VRVEGLLFAAGALFFGLLAVVYWFLSYETVGTTVLVLTAGLGFLIGFYVLFTGRRIGSRPEDRVDGEIEEGAGEMGFFSPHSWWPLPIAASGAVVFLGLIFGWWMVALGAVGLALSTIGLVFEYYRDEPAQ
jgi:hypothetical protein